MLKATSVDVAKIINEYLPFNDKFNWREFFLINGGEGLLMRIASDLLARGRAIRAKGILFTIAFVFASQFTDDGLPPGASGKKIGWKKCSDCTNMVRVGKCFFCWDRYGGVVTPLWHQYLCPKDEYWTDEQRQQLLPPVYFDKKVIPLFAKGGNENV